MKAAIKPRLSGRIPELSTKRSPERMSLDIFPKINGTTIRNENRAAFSLSTPSKTEVDMVAPDLEIPGSIAIA